MSPLDTAWAIVGSLFLELVASQQILRQASSPEILFPEDPGSLAEGRIFRQRSNTI